MLSSFTGFLYFVPNILARVVDLVTHFSKYICMDLGNDKCAYQKIEKGAIVSDGEPLLMNNLPIKSGPWINQ